LKVLVTGGAGFIGSFLVRRLIKDGHDVRILDDLSIGKLENIPDGVEFVRGSITDEKTVNKVVKDCNFVFHLAAQTDVRKSMEDPDFDNKVNFIGSRNVFLAASSAGARIIFTSSAAVYGDPEKYPVSELTRCEPISNYGKNKLLAEKECPENSFIVRLFNVYGVRGKSVINIFCRNAVDNRPLIIYGDGNQTRDYVFVYDVVDALMLGMKHTGLYNVGTAKETSLNDIVKIIREQTGKDVLKRCMPTKEGDIVRSFSDITKITKIGWKPKVDIKLGVKIILDSVV
jgi:UDP-glucose 4-epimerase